MHKENSHNSFLQRFQGRNQKINRDGLLQMLNSKIGIQNNLKMTKRSGRKEKEQDDYSIDIVKSKKTSKKQNKIFRSVELKAPQSQRTLDKMAFHLIRQQNNKPFESSNQFKLPTIHRSKSQNGNMKPGFWQKQIENEINSKKKSNSGSFYSKNSDKLTKKIEINQYILRHLEFLNKFQKKLMTDRQIDQLPNQKLKIHQ